MTAKLPQAYSLYAETASPEAYEAFAKLAWVIRDVDLNKDPHAVRVVQEVNGLVSRYLDRFTELDVELQDRILDIHDSLQGRDIKVVGEGASKQDSIIFSLRLLFASLPSRKDVERSRIGPPVLAREDICGEWIDLGAPGDKAKDKEDEAAKSERVKLARYEAESVTSFVHALAKDYLLALPDHQKRMGKAINELVLSGIRLGGHFLADVIPIKTDGYRKDRYRVLTVLGQLSKFFDDYTTAYRFLSSRHSDFQQWEAGLREQKLVEALTRNLSARGEMHPPVDDSANAEQEVRIVQNWIRSLLHQNARPVSKEQLEVHTFLEDYVPILVQEAVDMFLSPAFLWSILERVLDPSFTLPEPEEYEEPDNEKYESDAAFRQNMGHHISGMIHHLISLGNIGANERIVPAMMKLFTSLGEGVIAREIDKALRALLTEGRISAKVMIAEKILWDQNGPMRAPVARDCWSLSPKDLELLQAKIMNNIKDKMELSIRKEVPSFARWAYNSNAVQGLLDRCCDRALEVMQHGQVLRILFYYYLLPAIGHPV